MPPLAGAICNTANTASGLSMPPLAGAMATPPAAMLPPLAGAIRQHRQRPVCHRWRGRGQHRQRPVCHRRRGRAQHRQRRLQRHSWWIQLASWCPQLWLQWADVGDTDGPQRELEHCCLCGCGPVAVQPGLYECKPASLLRGTGARQRGKLRCAAGADVAFGKHHLHAAGECTGYLRGVATVGQYRSDELAPGILWNGVGGPAEYKCKYEHHFHSNHHRCANGRSGLFDAAFDIEGALIFQGASVTAANTVTIRMRNVTGAAVDGASRTWSYMVIRP
jgi:hypothetical protein